MDEKTARRHRRLGSPARVRPPRTWRTRPDPFAEVWAGVEARLVADPRLKAVTLFAQLQTEHPGRFPDSQRRSFERRLRRWRALSGRPKAVIFAQVHPPGRLGSFDFTELASLKITVGGRLFPHLLFHYVLTHSNAEAVRICFSESFEALSGGLQAAFHELGGVPKRVRSDSLSAAVNNLSDEREFRSRYGALLDHYQVEGEKTNPRQCQARDERRIARLMQASRLPPGKTWSAFDWKRLPEKAASHLRSLRDGSFLDRSTNLLIFGRPGSGKTHALAALGEQLVRQGRSVLFAPCSLLLQELLLAKRDLKLPRLIARLAKFEALIIDDLGYVQQSREEMEVLFTLLAERYERASALLSSNLAFSQWEQIFKDPMTTAAAIDRLVHHSVIVELNIPSYRLDAAKRSQQAASADDACS